MLTKAGKATISLFQKTGTVAQSLTEAQNAYGDHLNIGENLEKLHIFLKCCEQWQDRLCINCSYTGKAFSHRCGRCIGS